MKADSFNLIDEGWLPCLGMNGKPMDEESSMRHLFAHAHEIQTIKGETPLVTISLYRLLLVVLYHTIFECVGDSTDEKGWIRTWKNWWKAGKFDIELFNQYFSNYADRFDLFHPRYPFYQSFQTPGRKDKKSEQAVYKNISEMAHDITSGNNATLFEHRFDQQGFSLSAAQATRRLITIQSFGLSGLSGHPKKNYRTGSLVEHVIFLTRGETLFHTLMLNLQRYPTERETDDAPIWAIKHNRDPDKPGYMFEGRLDYFTWQSRFVLFRSPQENGGTGVNQINMSRGYALKLDEADFDPMKAYTRQKKNGEEFWVPVSWQEARSLWRNSATLFNVHSASADKERSPAAFKFLSDQNASLTTGQKYQFEAFGIVPTPAGGVNFVRHETFPLPLEYLCNEDAFSKLRENLDYAEKVGGKLQKACKYIVETLYAKSDSSKKARRVFSENVLRQFWLQLELVFMPMLVRSAQSEQSLDEESTQWRQTIDRLLRSTFEETITNVGENARAYKLYARCHEQLWPTPRKKQTKKTQPPNQKEGERAVQSEQYQQARRFIYYLERLHDSDQGPAAMAVMRRAFYEDTPVETTPMFKYIAHWLKEEGLTFAPHFVQSFSLVASLFALHPQNENKQSNMGTHLANLCKDMNPISIERRFSRLLDTPSEQLSNYLSQIVRLLESHEQPVNWAQLLDDLQQWNDPQRANQVKRRWALSFWSLVTDKALKENTR